MAIPGGGLSSRPILKQSLPIRLIELDISSLHSCRLCTLVWLAAFLNWARNGAPFWLEIRMDHVDMGFETRAELIFKVRECNDDEL